MAACNIKNLTRLVNALNTFKGKTPLDTAKRVIIEGLNAGNNDVVSEFLATPVGEIVVNDNYNELMDFITLATDKKEKGILLTIDEVIESDPEHRVADYGVDSTPELVNRSDLQIDQLSTNTESEDGFKSDFGRYTLENLPNPFEAGNKEASLLNFLNLYFTNKQGHYEEFFEKVNSAFREALIGARLLPGQSVVDLIGPVADMSPKFKEVLEKFSEEAKGIEHFTVDEINEAFTVEDKDAAMLRNAYYAFIIKSNIDIVLNSIVEGSEIGTDVTDDMQVEYAKDIRKDIASEYSSATKVLTLNIADNKIVTDLDLPAFVSDFNSTFDAYINDTSTSVLTDDSTVNNKKFIKISLDKTYSYKQVYRLIEDLNLGKIYNMNLGLDMLSKGTHVFEINVNNDIELISKPTILKFNVADSHRKGHGEVNFDAFNNDTAFIKYLIRTTPRLMERQNHGKSELYQDSKVPYMQEAEYYRISSEISALKDRSREGIARFLSKKLSLAKNVNTSDIVIYRSLYYTYFHDSTYEYIPFTSDARVTMVPLALMAGSKVYKAPEGKRGDANMANSMMSTLVQFFSKQERGRTFFKNGFLNHSLAAEINPFEHILPNVIMSKTIPEGVKTYNLDSTSSNLYVTVNNTKVQLTFYVDTASYTVDVKRNLDGKIVATLTGGMENIKKNEGKDLAALFKMLNLSNQLTSTKFTARLAAKPEATSKFLAGLLSYVALAENTQNTTLSKNASDVIKAIGKHYSKDNIYSILKVPMAEISHIFSEEYGFMSSTYEYNLEGNSTSKITNIDREGRVEQHVTDSKNKYNYFGIHNEDRGEALLNYANIGNMDASGNSVNPIFGKVTHITQRDGIVINGEVYTNKMMTLKHRAIHMVEGGFLRHMVGTTSTNNVPEILLQPMVYSDRTKISGHSIQIKIDLKADDAKDKLIVNYINTYRGRYASMQEANARAWSKFLYSELVYKYFNNPNLSSEKSQEMMIKYDKAIQIADKLSLLTLEELRRGDVLSTLAAEIHALSIPQTITNLSKDIVRNTHTLTVDGSVMPNTTGAVMLEYLMDDDTAMQFVQRNMDKYVETMGSGEFEYNDYTSAQARQDAADLFGFDISFEQMLRYHHLLTAPGGDSILDTLMTTEVEFEKPGIPNVMAEVSLEGRRLGESDYLRMLAERTQNYIRQSKRVQSQNSVGVKAEVKTSYGQNERNLPYDDSLVIQESKIDRVLNSNGNKFSVALSSGIFARKHGKYLIDGNPFIKFGSAIVPLVFSNGKFSAKQTAVYNKYSDRINEAVDLINTLGIMHDIPAPNADNELSTEEYNEVISATSMIDVDTVVDAIDNDEGSIGLGLDDVVHQILVDEDTTHGYINILGALGEGKFGKQDSLDGVIWAHPLYFIKLSASLGNEFSSFATQGSAVKDLSQYRDPVTGELIIQKKSTQNIFSNENLINLGNAKMYNTFKLMNSKFKFKAGYSLQYRDSAGKLHSKFVRSVSELQEFVSKKVAERGAPQDQRARLEEDMMNEMLPSWKERIDEVPTGLYMKVSEITSNKGHKAGTSSLQEFHDMQELWEHFGAFDNEYSWEYVAEVLALNPVARNAYVQKMTFTSAQKTGVKGMNDARLLHNKNVASDEIVTTEVPNDHHIVMLQKLHSFDTDDGSTNRSTLAITSQYLSAALFEGRTMKSALNATAGQAMMNNVRLTKFYRGLHQMLNSPEKKALKEAEIPLDSTNIKFSDMNPEDITTEIIDEFDDMMDSVGKDFARKLFTGVSTQWLLDNVALSKRSPVIVKMIKAMEEGNSFNSPLLRKAGTTTSRSHSYVDTTRVELPGFIAVTSPADFFLSLYGEARLGKAEALKFNIENGIDVYQTTAGELLNGDVLPTDIVRVHIKNAFTGKEFKTEYMTARLASKYSKDVVVDYTVLKERSTVLTGWGTDQNIKYSDAQYEDAYKRLASAPNIQLDFTDDFEGEVATDAYYYVLNNIIEHNIPEEQLADLYSSAIGLFIDEAHIISEFKKSELSEIGTLDEFKAFTREKLTSSKIKVPFQSLDGPAIATIYNPALASNEVEVPAGMTLQEAIDNKIFSTPFLEAQDFTEVSKALMAAGYDALIHMNAEGKIVDAITYNDSNVTLFDDSGLSVEFKGWKERTDKAGIVNAKATDRDFVKHKATGKVYMRFVAEAMFHYGIGEDFDAYELHTAADTDLNWAKYHILINGKEVPIESTDTYQKIYIFNHNKELYTAKYNEEVTKENVKAIAERLRAELRIMMETEDVRIDPVEVLAPNSNLAAFMMTEKETIQDILGYSLDEDEQLDHGIQVFKRKLRKAKVFKFSLLADIATEEDIDNAIIKLLKSKNTKAHIRAINEFRIEALRELKNRVDKMTHIKISHTISDINVESKKIVVEYENRRARDMAKSFMDSLYVMPPRIPSQGKQAGYYAKIKAFVHSNKNALYSPRESYTITGKDNDIDTDNVITKAVSIEGVTYDYKKYMLTEDGKIPQDTNGTSIEFSPILDKNNENPKLQQELKDIAKKIREKYVHLEDITGEETDVNKMNNEIYKAIKTHTMYFEKAVQNYIVDSLRYVANHPKNAVEAETPISMQELKAIIKGITDSIDSNMYNPDVHGINSFNTAWLPVLEHLNMEGKTAIADFANGQRTLAAILAVQYSLGTDNILRIGRGNTEITPADAENNKAHLAHIDDSTGGLAENVGLAITINGEKHIRDTYAGLESMEAQRAIATLQNPETSELGKAQAWEILSQLLSAATDNAKELLLGKLGANSDTNGIISAMIVMGFSFDIIHKFLTQGALTIVFKQLAYNRNKGIKASLRSVVKGFIAHNTSADYGNSITQDEFETALYELQDVIKAADALGDFRRVLTLAQQNRIDTYDLYKVLKPIHRREDLTVNSLLNTETDYGNKEFLEGTDEGPINSLFFIKNHIHARQLLKNTQAAERITRNISDIDALAAEKIVQEAKLSPYGLSIDSYDSLIALINEHLIKEYLQGKKAYLPMMEDKIAEYDMSSAEQRARFMYDVHISLAYMQQKIKNNAYLNELTPRTSREDADKTIVQLPFFMQKSAAEKSALQQSLSELANGEDPDAIAFNHAMAIYSLLKDKGKYTKHGTLSLYEDFYVDFSNFITKSDILGGNSILRNLIIRQDTEIDERNARLLTLAIPSMLPKLTVSVTSGISQRALIEDTSGELLSILGSVYEEDAGEFMHRSRTSKQDSAEMHEVIKMSEKFTFFTLNNDKLADSVYLRLNLGEKHSNVSVRLFKRSANETLPVDLNIPSNGTYDTLSGIDDETAQDIHRAGLKIGLKVATSLDDGGKPKSYGRVLSYLGKGMYLVTNSNGALSQFADSTLEELNPGKQFFGNNFGEASSYAKKNRHIKRSSRKAKILTDNTKTYGRYTVEKVGNFIKVKSKEGYLDKLTPAAAKAVIKYAVQNSGNNIVTPKNINNVEAHNLIGFLLKADALYDEQLKVSDVETPGSILSIKGFIKTYMDGGKKAMAVSDSGKNSSWRTGDHGNTTIAGLALSYAEYIGDTEQNNATTLKHISEIIRLNERDEIMKFTPYRDLMETLNNVKERFFGSSLEIDLPFLKFVKEELTNNNVC